jgi:hypothetical protein
MVFRLHGSFWHQLRRLQGWVEKASKTFCPLVQEFPQELIDMQQSSCLNNRSTNIGSCPNMHQHNELIMII